MPILDITLILVASAIFLLLQLRRVRKNLFWTATVTPLASIIGSGFLIVAPLLAEVVGKLAPLAMAAIAGVAIWIGSVIRFNIRHAEPLLNQADGDPHLQLMEQMSRVVLFAAYVISIAFYLRLMSSFVLEGFGYNVALWAQIMTTVILLAISAIGAWSGLAGLERMETVSVSIKLAIVVSLIIGLFHHNVVEGFQIDGVVADHLTIGEKLGMLAGMLLLVQGFETSRYLSNGYSAAIRARSMLLAQLLSSVMYVAFVALLLPLLHHLEQGRPDETSIIFLSSFAASILPLMLIVAAVMSQFSAAVADTVGSGGLMEEQTSGRISAAWTYLIVAALGILLVWTADIFEIVAIASRAFAAYYLLQTGISFVLRARKPTNGLKVLHLLSLTVLGAILLAVFFFALPVG